MVLALSSIDVQAEPNRQSGNKPIIYLTFDDGPSSDDVTERVLEVLAEHDATATFFVTGVRARANPGKIAKIVRAGHALGNHALSHRRLTTLADHAIADEFNTTNNYVYAAGGPPLNCFRAPFGDVDNRVKRIARSMGMRSVGWTIDTRDWDAYADPDYLAVQLEDSHHKSVVLMHDGPAARWRTLGVFSRWMQDTGDLYDFKALPDCTQPLKDTFALLDRDSEPMAKPVSMPPDSALNTKATETITSLLNKLRNYKLSLQPDLVAQTNNRPVAY